MAQPDNFGFNEEAALLKESARKFLAERFPTERLHAMVADDPNPERMSGAAWDRDLWQQMVDLGWTCLAVPESAGGLAMPLAAVAGLAEELGRAAFPCPLLGTLNATYVLAACGAAGESALAEIAGGSAATLAVTGPDGDCTEVSASGDGVLSGTAWYVQDARKADRLLVAARAGKGKKGKHKHKDKDKDKDKDKKKGKRKDKDDEKGKHKDKGKGKHKGGDIGLYWVAADAPGVTIEPDAIVDLTRDQAHVRFDDVQAERVSADACDALARAMPAVWTLLAADIAGAAEWQLQTTVEYVSTRQQFDRPLGFFQAVKHPLVDVMVQIDQTKSLVYSAASAFDHEPGLAARCAHMAKASASETAAFASGRSVQCHGGIGFTWECFIHLYFKRQKHSQMLWGDAAWHRARLAEILIDAA